MLYTGSVRMLAEAVARSNELEQRVKAEAPAVGWCLVDPHVEI